MVTINFKKYYELYTILKKIERALDLYIDSFVSMTKIQVQMRPCCRMHVCLMIWRWGVAINVYRHAINWQPILIWTHIKITVFKGRKAGAVIKQSLYFKWPAGGLSGRSSGQSSSNQWSSHRIIDHDDSKSLLKWGWKYWRWSRITMSDHRSASMLLVSFCNTCHSMSLSKLQHPSNTMAYHYQVR
jgi:hypothetical protein